MFTTTDDHTVTVHEVDPDLDAFVAVDVHVPAGDHELSDDARTNAALEQLWATGLASDDARPHDVIVTDVVTSEDVVIEKPNRRSRSAASTSIPSSEPSDAATDGAVVEGTTDTTTEV
jgi:hypothetical protein